MVDLRTVVRRRRPVQHHRAVLDGRHPRHTRSIRHALHRHGDAAVDLTIRILRRILDAIPHHHHAHEVRRRGDLDAVADDPRVAVAALAVRGEHLQGLPVDLEGIDVVLQHRDGDRLALVRLVDVVRTGDGERASGCRHRDRHAAFDSLRGAVRDAQPDGRGRALGRGRRRIDQELAPVQARVQAVAGAIGDAVADLPRIALVRIGGQRGEVDGRRLLAGRDVDLTVHEHRRLVVGREHRDRDRQRALATRGVLDGLAVGHLEAQRVLAEVALLGRVDQGGLILDQGVSVAVTGADLRRLRETHLPAAGDGDVVGELEHLRLAALDLDRLGRAQRR